MNKKYTFILFTLTSVLTLQVIAQQDVFSRSDSGTGDFGSANLPWFYPIGGNQGDPDNGNTTRNFVKIGHNNNTTMVTNGRFYIVGSLDFEAAASSPRTINNSGGGLSASIGIFNASSATHTFNTPIGIDGGNVLLHANSSGGLTFNQTIFINNNTIEFGNTGSGEILVNGIMQGTGNITKVGNNTLVLSANNIYTGTTTVSGGTLRLQGNLEDSDVTVGNGATLEIDSDVTIKSLTINAGGNVIVNSDSSLTIANNLNNSGTLNLTSLSTQYPSLIVNGSATGDVTYNRFVNSNILGNDLIAPPVDGQAWSSFLDPVNATALLDGGGAPTVYAFAPFNKTTGAYENYTTSTTATLNVGTGYRAATDSGETLSFTGSVESGTVTIDIENGGPEFAQWNLIGNPYPSFLNVQAFLNHEVSVGVSNLSLFAAGSEAIYGYDGDVSDGWTIYNLATTTASTVMAPGQGFFVSADATNAGLYDLEFTSAMRSTGTSDDFILGRNAELVYLTINLSSNTNAYNTDFYFNPNASEGFDLGYDASVWGGTAPEFSIYSHLVQDNSGQPIALQALNASSLSDVTIPLGVNANQGEQLTFSIADSTLPDSVNVYLEDTVANTSTLLNTGDYVITPSTNLFGTGRFFLRTSEDALSTIDNSLDALNIFALHSSKELVVSGQLQDQTLLNLYDIQGRIVFSTKLDTTVIENRMDVSNLSGGVYVVTIENNGQQKTQKVILK